MAEEFNQKPYAVNVFPVGSENSKFENVEVKGDVSLVNLHKNSKGEVVARLYNPLPNAEQFSIKICGVEAADIMAKAEIATVIFKDGKISIIHDKMPV